TWTFYLRKNATWTDGKPVVAADYVYAWQRIIDPKTGSLGADYISTLNLKNTSAIRDGKMPSSALGVEAKDDFTLVLHLEKPTPWLLDTVTLLPTAPVRKDIIEKYGQSWTAPQNIVSNGPYKLVTNRLNELVSFNLRDDYWDRKNIYITKINYEVLPKGMSSYLKYLAGEFYTARIPAQYIEQVLTQRKDELIAEPYPSTYAIVINTRRPQLQNPQVRQALSLLIDRNLIAQKFYRFYTPTTIVAPVILADGSKQQEQVSLLEPKERQANQQKAITLLKNAGYSKENPLVVNWVYTRGNEADRNNIAISSMLSDFSQGLVKVNLVANDLTTYYYKIQHYDFDLAFYIMNADFYHVASFFNVFNPGNSNNFSGWTDPEFTKLYDLAYQTKDESKRQEIYQQMNLILQEQVPVIPFLLSSRVIVKSPALGGFNGTLPFTYMRDYYLIADKHIAPVK
ncbi:peptide ABC transporter substrate-binding protein, partial [Psittacicella gerlachiana]